MRLWKSCTDVFFSRLYNSDPRVPEEVEYLMILSMEIMMVCFVRGLSRCARSAIAGKEVPTICKEAKKMDFLSQLEANPICD